MVVNNNMIKMVEVMRTCTEFGHIVHGDGDIDGSNFNFEKLNYVLIIDVNGVYADGNQDPAPKGANLTVVLIRNDEELDACADQFENIDIIQIYAVPKEYENIIKRLVKG